jgi:hypothetical protein
MSCGRGTLELLIYLHTHGCYDVSCYTWGIVFSFFSVRRFCLFVCFYTLYITSDDVAIMIAPIDSHFITILDFDFKQRKHNINDENNKQLHYFKCACRIAIANDPGVHPIT